MTKRRHIIPLACVVVLAAGYFVGWHTWAGLALRGTSTLYIKNDSDTPLRNVEIRIANSIDPSVTNRFDIIRAHQRKRVPVPKSHIYVWGISWEQGQRTNAPDLEPGVKVHMGTTMELVVDATGKISTVDDD
jgi:hypothetical protein